MCSDSKVTFIVHANDEPEVKNETLCKDLGETVHSADEAKDGHTEETHVSFKSSCTDLESEYLTGCGVSM